MTFREKLETAMLGHGMAEIVDSLTDALGIMLAEADPAVRDRLIEETCVRVARKASVAKK